MSQRGKLKLKSEMKQATATHVAITISALVPERTSYKHAQECSPGPLYIRVCLIHLFIEHRNLLSNDFILLRTGYLLIGGVGLAPAFIVVYAVPVLFGNGYAAFRSC